MTYAPVYAKDDVTLVGVMCKTERGSFFVQARKLNPAHCRPHYNWHTPEVDRGIERMMRENRAPGL